MVGPSDVIAAAANLQSHLSSNVSNISQRAALEALTGTQEPEEQMRLAFDRRRRTMVRMLQEIPGVECPEPTGAFYCFPNVEGVLGKGLRGRWGDGNGAGSASQGLFHYQASTGEPGGT